MRLINRFLNRKTSSLDNQPKQDVAIEGDAAQLLDKGMGLEQQGLVEEALQCYRTATELMPNLALGHFKQGIILLDRGEANEAIHAFSEAIKYKPESAAAHYNTGNAQHLLGRYEAAVISHRQAIALKPNFVDAFAALGRTLEDMGQYSEALSCYRQALDLQPDYVEVQLMLANLLKAIGRLEEAAVGYRKVLELQPDFAELHGNLGNVLNELGRFAEAAASYRQVLSLRPNDAIAYNNLGNVLKELDCIDESMASYCRAVEIDPEFVVAHFNIGLALQRLHQYEQALASYKVAVRIDPDYAEVHLNMGVVLRELAQLERAESCCRHALAIRPDYAEAHLSLGNVQQDRGQYDEAISSYRRALTLKPGYADAHINLGAALTMIGRLNDAVASYRRALEIQPNNAETHNNLGSALVDLGRLEDGMASSRKALELKPAYTSACSNLLFQHNYLGDQSASLMLAEARRFGQLVASMARPRATWENTPDPDRLLRVGLVSGDLRQHPVGYFIEGVLTMLASRSRGRLEIFAYSSRAVNDPISKRIQACCDHWQLVAGISDADLAEQIAREGIDVLIDLSGHTAHNRLPLFAWKASPIQVSWLGYFATTGVAAIDYFIADPWTLPPGEEGQFTEKIWRLPETRLCFTAPEVDVSVSPLPALENGYITFGCLNNLNKMNAEVVSLWARILIAVPHSRLLLKCSQFLEVSIRDETLERFAAHGIEASRLILDQYVPRANYLEAYQRVDICLDPFPFPGGTTTAEALWMGVPVLTLAGNSFLSRQGVGLMMNAGLIEWIATDPDNYVARAISHASELQTIAALRYGLRKQVLASPIFDATRFANHFEDALRSMWHLWCAESLKTSPPAEDINYGII